MLLLLLQQGCSFDHIACELLTQILGALAYHPKVQNNLAQANYFRFIIIIIIIIVTIYYFYIKKTIIITTSTISNKNSNKKNIKNIKKKQQQK